jgi:chromosomal replication initiator protein
MKPLHIIVLTAMVFQVPVDVVRSKSRIRTIVDCRKASMLLVWLLCQPITYSKVGYCFCRDRCTFLNAVKSALDLIETDKQFKQKFELTAKILMG